MPPTVERLNTEDTVMATTKKTTPDEPAAAATATSNLSADEICDYCHVRMAAIKQMTLNDRPHEVRACTADPSHTKTVLIG